MRRRSPANVSRYGPHLSVLLLLFLIPQTQSVLNSGDTQAAAYWQNRTIAANGCDWTNGGSEKDPLREPTITENVLQFSLTNFLAQSIDGVSTITSDCPQFDAKELNIIGLHKSAITALRMQEKFLPVAQTFTTNLNLYESQSSIETTLLNYEFSIPEPANVTMLTLGSVR